MEQRTLKIGDRVVYRFETSIHERKILYARSLE
jgi:hypothetical protein